MMTTQCPLPAKKEILNPVGVLNPLVRVHCSCIKPTRSLLVRI